MSQVRVSRIANALLAKGFEAYESHHTMYRLVVGGKTTSIRTRISHGERQADDWLLAQIARQLHLSKRELLHFIDCEIGQRDYVELMIQRGHLRL